jgi:hypothetical protein
VRLALPILALLLAACTTKGTDSGAVTSPPPVEVVKPTAETPFDRVFSWRPVGGATSYRVIVFNSAGERSFEVRDVRGTSVAVAQSVNLLPGRYSWQVQAFRNDQQMSESAVTPFDLK